HFTDPGEQPGVGRRGLVQSGHRGGDGVGGHVGNTPFRGSAIGPASTPLGFDWTVSGRRPCMHWTACEEGHKVPVTSGVIGRLVRTGSYQFLNWSVPTALELDVRANSFLFAAMAAKRKLFAPWPRRGS